MQAQQKMEIVLTRIRQEWLVRSDDAPSLDSWEFVAFLAEKLCASGIAPILSLDFKQAIDAAGLSLLVGADDAIALRRSLHTQLLS